MDLIALAIPFFLLAVMAEAGVDRMRGTGFYRANDAVNSLSAGTISTTTGYFTKLLPGVISAWVLQHLALIDVDPALFDFSLQGLALWALALLAFDFCYYWKHRFGHEISVLWAAHSVHHQSEDYNLSTALRQTSTDFVFGWIFYLPLFLLGMPFEIFVTVNALDLIYQFWVHTQVIRKLGWLDRVMVTPSNHRVHHAQNERYIDKNYGGIFVLWDRLFGTFQEELDDEPVVFGVRKPLQSWNPFWANLQVYNYLWFDALRARRWTDKLTIWFRRTGWRPKDVEAQFPKHRADIASFRKFDPPTDPAVRRYVLAQMVLTAVFVLGTGLLLATKGIGAIVVPCIAIWTALLSLGFLSEAKPYAFRFEFFRLLVIFPACLFLLYDNKTLSDDVFAGTAIGVSAASLVAVAALFVTRKFMMATEAKDVLKQ